MWASLTAIVRTAPATVLDSKERLGKTSSLVLDNIDIELLSNKYEGLKELNDKYGTEVETLNELANKFGL